MSHSVLLDEIIIPIVVLGDILVRDWIFHIGGIFPITSPNL